VRQRRTEAGQLKDKVRRTASFLAPGHTSSLLFVICPYLKRAGGEGAFVHIKRGYPGKVRIYWEVEGNPGRGNPRTPRRQGPNGRFRWEIEGAGGVPGSVRVRGKV